MIEKSINDLLDSVERKREELVNKESVMKELKIIQAREKEELEEEFQLRQRQLEETQNADAERITEERGKLRSELESLEAQLEELMSTKSRGEEDQALPCPECPVCLELLLPPIRIMQCTNGHLVCETCEAKAELTCCPTCRQVLVKVFHLKLINISCRGSQGEQLPWNSTLPPCSHKLLPALHTCKPSKSLSLFSL